MQNLNSNIINLFKDEYFMDEVSEYRDELESNVQALKSIMSELSSIKLHYDKLAEKKDLLSKQIIDALGHEHKGQKTYRHNQWKIEVKTPVTYSINSDAYKRLKNCIPLNLNPIKETITYKVDKVALDKCLADAPSYVISIISYIIDEKSGKESVTIKEAV